MGKAQYRLTDDGKYAIGSILFKGMLVEFLIDTADLERVRPYRWHYTSNAYIATSVTVDISGNGTDVAEVKPKKREVYLHTFLLSPPEGHAVQHISKNGLDNRRDNLRLVAAAAAATSAAPSKKRTAELPALCGIKPEQIPKHVWYVHANGYHSDRFAIEFKAENILWKSTSSKKVSLQEKLEQAQAKLEELYTVYPHLDPKREEERIDALKRSFELIMQAPPSQAPPPPLAG